VGLSEILAGIAKLSSGVIYALIACGLWMMVITGTGLGFDLKPVSFSHVVQYIAPALLGTWFLWLNYRREKSEVSFAGNAATTNPKAVRSIALRLIVSTALAIGVILAIVVSVAAYMRADFNAVRDALLKATADSPSPGNQQAETINPTVFTSVDEVKTDEDIVNSIIPWEGGYYDSPSVSGGPTNYGVTLNALTAWRGTPVTADDIRTLSLAEAQSYYLYRIASAGYDSIANLPLIKEVNAAADPTELRAAIVCGYLSVLRKHPGFSTFQKGFLSRVRFLYPANRAMDC
jgi:hypothetical protein